MARVKPLDALSRTALIPFWARAQDAACADPILGDKAALELAPLVEQRFGVQAVSPATRIGCCLRSRVMDGWLAQLARNHAPVSIVDVGIGLDTRLRRMSLPVHRYVEIDSRPVIEFRQQLMPDDGSMRIVGDGLSGSLWDDGLDAERGVVIIVLEGVLAYHEPARVHGFFTTVAEMLPGAFVLFDSLSPLAAWLANRPGALASGRPAYLWATKKADRVVTGSARLHVLDEKRFVDFPHEYRLMYSPVARFAYGLPLMRSSYRLTLAQIAVCG